MTRDDLIDRQAAIDVLSLGKEMLSRVLDDMDVVGTDREKYSWGIGLIESNINDIEELPSAQPEQRWIPCSEQEYPSDNREVEVTCEVRRLDGKIYQYTCHASYVHRYSIESTDYCNWEECDEYNEEEDKYYALPGWYERVHNWDDYSYCAIEDRVVAWRELSKPWRGEQDDSD